MADKEIKDFDAVVTPAAADRMVTQQASDDVTRRMTATQIVEAVLHAARHISGGADAFTSSQLLEAIVKRIQTSDGPTNLLPVRERKMDQSGQRKYSHVFVRRPGV